MRMHCTHCSKTFDVLDAKPKPIEYDLLGFELEARTFYCPRCGTTLADKIEEIKNGNAK